MNLEAFTLFPILSTNRLKLRQLRATDEAEIFAIKSDREVTEPYGTEPQHTIEDTREWIQRLHTSYEKRDGILWCITLKGDDAVIGSCCFWNFQEDLRCAELGYELARTYWRQGMMAEAVSAVLTWGFNEFQLNRVEACPLANNVASKSLLLKLGFTFEGNLRERVYFRGRYEDQLYYGLLKDEWIELSSNTSCH